MKLNKQLLLGGLVLVSGLLLLDSQVPQIAFAQKGGGGGGGKGAPLSRADAKFLGIFKDVVAKAAKSTFRIQCDGKDVALGVAVSTDGYILTKLADLQGKITLKTVDGVQLDAKIVGRHEAHDLAMLKVEASGFTPITWSETKVAPVGYFVASVGPKDVPIAVGVVSVAARTVPAAKGGGGVKGPPSNSGYLGVNLMDTEKGVLVTSVIPKTAASGANVKANDFILEVGGKVVKDMEDCIATIQKHKAGETVTLKLLRGEEKLELKVPLGKQDPVRADVQNNMGSKLSSKRSGFPIVLQHDSVVLPEDCGGPLVDLEGHVLGINIARAGRVDSVAIPAEVIQPLLPDLMAGKMLKK